MTNLSPDDNTPNENSAQQIAQRMDPNVELALQQANAAGDTSVAQAMEKYQITNMQQLMQLAENGLIENVPPVVQDMIDEKNRQLALQDDGDAVKAKQKEEAEYEDIADRMAQNNEARAAAAERDAAENDGHGKSYSEMDAAEKAAFLENTKNLTAQDWQNMSQTQRLETVTNVSQALDEMQQKNGQDRDAAIAKLRETYGADADKILENQEKSRAQALKEMGLTEESVKNLSYDEIGKLHKRQEEIREGLNAKIYPDDPEKQKHLDKDAGLLDSFSVREDNNNSAIRRVGEAKNEVEKQEIFKALPKVTDGAEMADLSGKDSAKAVKEMGKDIGNVSQEYKQAAHSDDISFSHKQAATQATIEAAHLAAGHADLEKTIEHAAVENMEAGEALRQKEHAETLAKRLQRRQGLTTERLPPLQHPQPHG
jgi:hypothetical protein